MPEDRRDRIRAELSKVAPGTALREGLDMIISARTGALIVIGETASVQPLCNGGFAIDIEFTPQRLFELAKMDGAILLDEGVERILRANAHLVPDPSLPTSETGMRHRTAERVSRQTGALVISISQRREIVNLYIEGMRIMLEETTSVLAKANQALQTLQRYRTNLDHDLDRLTVLEFDDVVTIGDVAETIARFEAVRRVGREVRRAIVQLGTEGRLVAMQADELLAGVDEGYALVLRDYLDEPTNRRAGAARAVLGDMPLDGLHEAERVAAVLGLSVAQRTDEHVRPRGYRALDRIPMLPPSVVARIVDRFGTLSEVLVATEQELDAVDGVGARRAEAIVMGLERRKLHAEAEPRL